MPVLPAGEPVLLSELYLQDPGDTAVSVTWLTNFGGDEHWVRVERGKGEFDFVAAAKTAESNSKYKSLR